MPHASPSAASPAARAVSHAEMANAIRALSMDAVEQANSGHPGMPMGMADVATVLYRDFLSFDPTHPHWPNRDRFVLSAGHGSMLLYSLLYLTGYADITLEEIKRFRQLGAKTAGHPEYGHAAGIETTTGPLGQGLANAVGMALSETMLRARFGEELVSHYTYVIAGDGCLMEGISHEAMSLAGHLKLHKLIVLWDDNKISIDGPTDLTVSEDTLMRAKSYGWHALAIDGHNPDEIRTAIAEAKRSDKPTLIACRTVIGYGCPNKAGTAATHGAPLGAKEIEGVREKLGWPHAPFAIPDPVLSAWRAVGVKGAHAYQEWEKNLSGAKQEMHVEFERLMARALPEGWVEALEGLKRKISEGKPKEATRKSSQNVLEILNAHIPELIGGSADLTGSNNTKTGMLTPVTAQDYSGRYLYYGVREHAMGAIMNGLALHGAFIPYGGTFLVFSDYCRPAIRLSALMKQQAVYVMTHDSIGLGEDGPTHQPVEHLPSLRAMPGLYVFRPADATETLECWAMAVSLRNAPSLLALSRQNLPSLREAYTKENLCARGGYVIRESWIVNSNANHESPTTNHQPCVTLIATGSEVHIALDAQRQLAQKNVAARVVSLPCWELFDEQPKSYREEVLGGNTLKVAIEAAASFGWERYIGADGIFIGMQDFGASAPAEELYKAFGITADNIAAQVLKRI